MMVMHCIFRYTMVLPMTQAEVRKWNYNHNQPSTELAFEFLLRLMIDMYNDALYECTVSLIYPCACYSTCRIIKL